MTKLKGRWIAGLGGAVVIVAMTVFPVFADEGHGQMGHGDHDQDEQEDQSAHYLKHLLKHAKEIGLTPEQISKVKAIHLDFKRSEARLEADEKVAKLELHALLEDEQVDLTAIQAKVDQLKKAEAACLFTAIKSKRNAMAMLTPDQREKDRVVHEQMKTGVQHGGGMGGMGRGGMMGVWVVERWEVVGVDRVAAIMGVEDPVEASNTNIENRARVSVLNLIVRGRKEYQRGTYVRTDHSGHRRSCLDRVLGVGAEPSRRPKEWGENFPTTLCWLPRNLR